MAVRLHMCSRLTRSLFALDALQLENYITKSRQWRLLSTPSAESTTSKDSTPDESASKGSASSESDALQQAEAAFKEEKEKLTTQLTEMQDKYKRSLAETENVRQRMKKQVDDAKLFGIQGFCKDLLEVADILGKATESVPKDQLNSGNPHLKNLYDGLSMTDSQLHKVLTRNGVNKIDPTIGEKFDPNIHEALFQAPVAEGKEPGTVATVTKLGYTLHNRTLRPALVGVFKDA